MKNKGWRKEPARHSLSSRGLKSTPMVKKVKSKKIDLHKTKYSISFEVARKRADQLNKYMGDSTKWFANTPNPWEDVIYTWDNYDEAETNRHDKHHQSDVVFFKDSNYLVIYNYGMNEWVAESKKLFNLVTSR